mgnify:CR=1 FL=1
MSYQSLERCEAATSAAFAEPTASQLAKDVAIYLAHVEKGIPMRTIAAAKGAAPSTILRAVRRVETMRDDPLLDRTLAELEADIGAPLDHDPSAKETPVHRPKHKADMTKM